MSGKYYVYVHTRNDTGKVFYVGKGQGKRAWSSDSRNPHWKSIVKKAGGHTVNIVFRSDVEQEAFDEEMRLILKHGRIDLGTGILCNKTDGGEGTSGAVCSPETRERMTGSNNHMRKAAQGNPLSYISLRPSGSWQVQIKSVKYAATFATLDLAQEARDAQILSS